MMIIVAVMGSTAVSAAKLLKSKEELGEGRMTENRRATVTVLTLSLLFCSLNLLYITITVLTLAGAGVPHWMKEVGHYLLLPLNSAANPVVYFVRKQRMRTYAKKFLFC